MIFIAVLRFFDSRYKVSLTSRSSKNNISGAFRCLPSGKFTPTSHLGKFLKN